VSGIETLEFDNVVIGAGVVGLACAEALSRRYPNESLIVLERHFKFGQEASSHNSEVVHAGIYYTPGTLKARSCVEGKKLLYDFCREHQVPIMNCGKYVVASDDSHIPKLKSIRETAAANGVELEWLESAEATRRVGLELRAALWSPTSGIVDSHVLMERLAHLTESRGGMVLYKHAFHELESVTDTEVSFIARTGDGESMRIRCRRFVNAAGLASARIAEQFRALAGRGDSWQIKPCRGRYFTLASEWTGRYKFLIYPVPDPRGGLGTHLTIDLGLRGRLGPDVDWSRQEEPADLWDLYRFDDNVEELRDQFFEAGSKFLPGLKREHLEPDYVGVRAKLFKNGVAHPEFVIDDLGSHGLHTHLLGIESPGVTSSLALADLATNKREANP
jgi:2-hydroxyglutarate dehydrogenase